MDALKTVVIDYDDRHKITVEYRGSTGVCTSTLADEGSSELWKAACDVLESMILNCACTGVKIDTPEFKTAVSLTIDAMSNEIGDD